MRIRSASVEDAPAVGAIYGHHVLTGLGAFEEVPPSETDMAGRIAAVLAHGLPYLVAEDEVGRVLGFAYASPFRPRRSSGGGGLRGGGSAPTGRTRGGELLMRNSRFHLRPAPQPSGSIARPGLIADGPCPLGFRPHCSAE